MLTLVILSSDWKHASVLGVIDFIIRGPVKLIAIRYIIIELIYLD